MGGHGSLWLASRHPDIWGNAGSMSGGVNILPFPKSWRMSERLGSIRDKQGGMEKTFGDKQYRRNQGSKTEYNL